LDIAHVVNDAARCARLTSADEAASHLRYILEDVLALVDLDTLKEGIAGYDELTVETIQRAIKLVGSVRCLLCPGRKFDPNDHSHRARN